jgi:hypothetical protein
MVDASTAVRGGPLRTGAQDSTRVRADRIVMRANKGMGGTAPDEQAGVPGLSYSSLIMMAMPGKEPTFLSDSRQKGGQRRRGGRGILDILEMPVRLTD